MLTVQSSEILIKTWSNTREFAENFVHGKELFGILHSIHLSIGHSGRDRMTIHFMKY